MIRSSIDDGEFIAFYMDGGEVTAALTVGRSYDLEHARKWIARGRRASVDVLADLNSALSSEVYTSGRARRCPFRPPKFDVWL